MKPQIHISVFLEISGNSIEPVSLQILNRAKELAKNTHILLSAVSILEEEQSDIITELPEIPDKVFEIVTEDSKIYNEKLYSENITAFLQEHNVDIFFAGATTLGRSLMPLCAAKLNAALTADCTELTLDKNGHLIVTRPTFGGNLMAQIIAPDSSVQMATIRPNIFPIPDNFNKTVSASKIVRIAVNNSSCENTILEVIKKNREDISHYDIIVAGGRGVGSKENFELLYEFAKKIGGTVAGSRAVVDAGWVPQSRQIGQTGKTVTPEIYIAIGISGAVQHLAGMSGSKKIIAINIDKNADIFKVANYGIVSDYKDILIEFSRN